MACYLLVLDWNRRHRELMPKVQSISLCFFLQLVYSMHQREVDLVNVCVEHVSWIGDDDVRTCGVV